MSKKKTKIYLGIPSTGTRVDIQNYALRRLEAVYKDEIEFVYPTVFCQRMFHDFARNEIVKEFLATDCDILWFLDSDVSPPPHILDLVTVHGDKWQVAGAPYPVFMTPTGHDLPAVVMCVYDKNSNGLYAGNCPQVGTGFVAGLATGCLFIKREVFSQIEQPYFEFKYKEDNRCIIEGEDLGFCLKMAKLGIEFFTDYSMVCHHFKNVDLLQVNNYAVTYANKAVLAYDTQVRPKVDALVARLKEQAPPKRSSLYLPD